jgi:hypothetical protein
VAIYPTYPHHVSLLASGKGTVTIIVNDVDNKTVEVNSPNHTNISFTTTKVPVKFAIRTTGDVVVNAPRLTMIDEVAGCKVCMPNYWCNGGSLGGCPSNAISPPGTINPTECTCAPGYYGTSTYWNHDTACTGCPANHYCLGGEFTTVCPNGTRTDPTLRDGMYADGLDKCIPCAEDEYCADGSTSMCPGHATSPISSWDVTHCICDPGYYGTAPDCKLCEPGYYCFGGIKTACTGNALSPAGASNASNCFCEPGYYGVGNELCTACPEKSFCSSGIITPCPNNMWSEAYSSVIGNCSCDYGAYAVNVACSLCSAGTYKSARGPGACKICASGTFATARGAVDSSVCVGCAPGSYAFGTGQYQCQQCEAGYYASGASSSSCTACSAGAYSSFGASVCTTCMAGTYSPTKAATSIATCTTCEVGAWSHANSTACTLCGACWYWKFPPTVYFQTQGQPAVVFTSTEKYFRFAKNAYDDSVIMAMGTSLYKVDLTTGVRSAALKADGPSNSPWFYASISTSVFGNYLYVVRNPNVYRVDLNFGTYDIQYPSNLASCVVEDSSQESVVLWIVQPTMVRKVDPTAAIDISTYTVSGANYACLSPTDPLHLYVTGTFGIRKMNKNTGAFTNIRTGTAYTVCQVTPDGLFVLVASATAKNLVAVSLFDGTTFNILAGTVTGLLFDANTMVTGVDGNGVVNLTIVSSDSRSCIPGQFGRNAGMTSPESCTVCPAGNLCPGGANVSACKPGTFSNTTGQREQGQCYQCPAGSFCEGAVCPGQMDCAVHPTTGVCSGPDCTAGDFVRTCPPGTYSVRTGLKKESDCPQCVAGYWCPNSLSMRQCPNNTLSPAGAKDLSECACAPGYECIITKVVHATVIISMSQEQFTPSVQAQYRAAIAASAGIDVSLVSIQGIFSITTPPTGRRLLSHRRGAPWDARAVEVHTLIRKTTMVDLSDLDTHLSHQGLPPNRGVTMALHEEVLQSYRQEW